MGVKSITNQRDMKCYFTELGDIREMANFVQQVSYISFKKFILYHKFYISFKCYNQTS